MVACNDVGGNGTVGLGQGDYRLPLLCGPDVEVERLDQVQGGLAQGQLVDGRPKVQDVARGAATGREAAKHVLLDVRRKRTIVTIIAARNRARPSTLRADHLETIEMAQPVEHLSDGHLGTNGGEVHSAIGPCAAGDLPTNLPRQPRLFQLAIPLGKDLCLAAGQLVRWGKIRVSGASPWC